MSIGLWAGLMGEHKFEMGVKFLFRCYRIPRKVAPTA
jgi:hypothetical protein